MFDGKRLLKSTKFFLKSTFKSKLRRNREPSRIPVKKVLNYLRRKCYRTAMKRFISKNFPVSSHLHDLCKHYREWSFQYNRDNACRWNVSSGSVTKRKSHKSHFRTSKFKLVRNSESTTCTCHTNSGISCSPSSFLSGGIEPTPFLVQIQILHHFQD